MAEAPTRPRVAEAVAVLDLPRPQVLPQPPPVPAPAPSFASKLRNLETFSSLQRNPNFRLYWYGALTSNVGTWMQMVAQGWLVYQITASAFMLGMVSFAGSAPVLLFSLYGGVLADRMERRRLMVWTQTASMLLAFLLAFLTFRHMVTVWHIIGISFFNGVANAFNTPVRQSIISDLVKKEDLQNAIAINSTQFQTSRTLGPALAGLTLAAVGPAWCFFLNAMSFLAVIWTLLVMDVPPLPPRRKSGTLSSILEGLRYVRTEQTIFALLLVAGIPALFVMPYQMMMPAFAESVLRAGPAGLGVLQSAAGAGAVAGALTIASIPKSMRTGALQFTMIFVGGFGLEAFGLSKIFGLSIGFLFVVGFAQMAYTALNQSFLQHLIADEMRGRVLSLLTLTTFGLQPFGAMIAGTLAAAVGPQVALVLQGCACVLCVMWVLVRWPQMRTLQ